MGREERKEVVQTKEVSIKVLSVCWCVICDNKGVESMRKRSTRSTCSRIRRSRSRG